MGALNYEALKHNVTLQTQQYVKQIRGLSDISGTELVLIRVILLSS